VKCFASLAYGSGRTSLATAVDAASLCAVVKDEEDSTSPSVSSETISVGAGVSERGGCTAISLLIASHSSSFFF
jgi:hypothetical protein